VLIGKPLRTASGRLLPTWSGGTAPIVVPVPAGLGWTPEFTIYDLNGQSYTNFDMAAVKPVADYVYYCSPSGSAVASPASNDPAAPITPRRLVTLANAHGGNIKAFLAPGIYYGNISPDGNNFTCAGVVMELWVGQGTGRALLVKRNTNAAAVWTFYSGTTCYTPHSTAGTSGVWDTLNKDSGGAYTRPNYAPDLATCLATPGTCFYDSATSRMYVNPIDGRSLIGDQTMIVTTNGRVYSHIRTDNAVTWIGDGIDMIGGTTMQQATVGKTAGFYTKDCGLYGSDSTTTGSLAIVGPIDVRLIQCRAGGAILDGLNYHGNSAGDPRVLEDRCYIIRSGYQAGGTANNADTYHELGKGISVGCTYKGSQNRVIQNINTSKTFYVRPTVEASLATDATSVTIVAGSADGQASEIWIWGLGSGGIQNSLQGGFYAYAGSAIRYANDNFAGITVAPGSAGTIGSYAA